MPESDTTRNLPLQPGHERASEHDRSYYSEGYDYTWKQNTADHTSLRVMEGAIELVAILLVAFSPIAFGATERWSKTVVQAGVSAMCAAWCFRAVLRHELSFAKSPLNLLIAAFLLLACVQLLPLPGFVAARVCPAAVYAETGSLPGANPCSIDGSVATGTEAPADEAGVRCISPNRAASRSFLYLVASYAIAFLVIINTFRRRAQLSHLLGAVVAVGFTVAILGVLGYVAPNGKILWVRDPPVGAIPFGPFVNRNHFAGYLVMVVPVALGLMIATRDREKRALLGFASALMAAAVFVSSSRGGVFSLAAATTAFALMLIRSKAAKRNLFPLVIVACAAIFGAAVIGIEPLLARTKDLIGADPTAEYRFPLWKDTTRMIAAFPLFGVGIGCFRSVFPMYKTFNAQLAFTHVENDYLHLLAEMGIAGFVVGMLFIGLILRSSLRGLTTRRSTFSQGLMIGLAAAVVGMLTHSLVDFNLHVPSNGLLFAMILGILVVLGSVHLSHSGRRPRTSWIAIPSRRLLKGETIVAPGTVGAFCMSLATLCVLASCVASSAGGFVAERELDWVEHQVLQFVKGKRSLNLADGIRTVQDALAKDRENGEWHFKAGLFYQTLGQLRLRSDNATLDSAGVQCLYRLATNELKKACALDRFSSRYRTTMAVTLAEIGKHAEAERNFRIAMKLNPTSAWTHRKCGHALWDVKLDTAQRAFRRALGLDPGRALVVLTQLSSRTQDIDELRECIPENNEALFEYARFLVNNGFPQESEKVLVALLAEVESNPSNRHLAASILFRLGQIKQNSGAEQDALTCFLKAVALQPNKHAYYEELGYACLRSKRYEEARRFLEQRLRMSPERDGRVFLALAEVYENVGPVDTAHRYYCRALEALPESWNVSRNRALQGIERTADQ